MPTALGTCAMKTTCINPTEQNERVDETTAHESTYGMLMREEEKDRSLLETVVYLLFVLSIVAAIWQFAQESIEMPSYSDETITAGQVSAVSTVCDATKPC